MRRVLVLFALAFSAVFAASAQSEKFNHVQWTLGFDQASVAPGGTVLGRLEARVDPEWHMYSLTTPPGPIPTTISLETNAAVEQVSIFQPPPVRKFDPNFNADTRHMKARRCFWRVFSSRRMSRQVR